MTRGLVRYHHTSGFHFLTWSRHRRQPYLSRVEAPEKFLGCLERMWLRYRFVVAG